ncbi:hypothetical protein PO124_00790 [Bacillus licheniformis]|nr:hypothetical protein [Bacillus licheniformis]
MPDKKPENIRKASAELEQVRRQIEEERSSWETEREALIDQAKQEGFQAGFEEGKAEARSAYQAYLDEANAIVRAARRDYEEKSNNHPKKLSNLPCHWLKVGIKG